ncbi:MAG: acyl-CoA synthetase, partial [Lentisphaerales bacterium]
MGILLKTVIRLKGGSIKRSFDRSTEHPQAVQDNLLLEILRNRRDTDYGRRHGFSRVTGTEAFTKSVPINDFSNLALYVERMKRGERDVLVPGQPLMFNVTSGTTDKPKYIPVTRRGLSLTSEISNQWLYRVLQDHPTCLDQAFLCVTGSSLEGRTVAGIPYGSASGLIYRNLPRALRPSLVLPFAVSDIKSYDLRYYLMTRLALEKEVSCATTPNPTTLMKLAETATDYQEEIVRSINDGVLFRKLPFDVNHDDAGILDILGVSQRPNRSRAQSLEAIISRHGHLVPSEYWKELKLIGCWLGGSVGFQVDKLSALLGQKVPMRDIGFRASEGSLTVPCEDNTSAGILALDNAYYEFVPAAENTSEDTRTLRSHELEDGKQYKIIITNWDG